MKVQMTYNGKTVEVEVADEQFEKLFVEEKKKTGYEKVEEDEQYWYVDSVGNVTPDVPGWTLAWDNKRYENANYFSDEEVANSMERAQRLWNRIHRRAVELCKPCYRWADGELYTICFSPDDEFICAVRTNGRQIGSIYFDTEEHCQQAISEFRNELMWYFTEFKDRADM